MAYLKNNKKCQRGLTLIEVIAVFVIIAVLAAIAVSRVMSTKEVSAITERDILKSHLRYAQMRALSDDESWGISCNGTTYTLLRNGATAPYNLPGEGSAVYQSENNITFNCGTITFDEWGSPDVDEDIEFSVNPGGYKVKVTKNTGFIP